jgi:hypothetical protein
MRAFRRWFVQWGRRNYPDGKSEKEANVVISD